MAPRVMIKSPVDLEPRGTGHIPSYNSIERVVLTYQWKRDPFLQVLSARDRSLALGKIELRSSGKNDPGDSEGCLSTRRGREIGQDILSVLGRERIVLHMMIPV
jgi:hypothetical protein